MIRTTAVLLLFASTAFADGFVITEHRTKGFVLTEVVPEPAGPSLPMDAAQQADDNPAGPPSAASTSGAASSDLDVPVKARPVLPIGSTVQGDNIVWRYSNGLTRTESKAAYRARTGKSVDLCCSTGFCTHHAGYAKTPTAGCTCGCNASECSCPHSPVTPSDLRPAAKPVSVPINVPRAAGSVPVTYPSPFQSPALPQAFYGGASNCPGGNCYSVQRRGLFGGIFGR